MTSGKNQLNPSKRQSEGKDKRSITIEGIRKEIESRSGESIESLRKSCRDEAHFYAKCLVFVAATNNALCVAIGIPIKDGRKYAKALRSNGCLFRATLIQCPVINGRDWLITTDPRKADFIKRGIPIPPPKRPQ